MSSPTSSPARSEAFTVSQRLMRGYGPLAVFVLMILLMSVLVPSKVPDKGEKVAAGQPAASSDAGGDTQYAAPSGNTNGQTTPSGSPSGDCATTTTEAAKGGKADKPASEPCEPGSTSGTTAPSSSGSGGSGSEVAAPSGNAPADPAAPAPGSSGAAPTAPEGQIAPPSDQDHSGKPPTGGDPTGAVGDCPDREEQVPGDPYSPPCIAFAGDNGGATAKGVTADEISVAFRVLNEKGFQQTLAELAGASLEDTPETIQRTVEALADYFNEYFQFYGRKIKIHFYDGQGSNTDELLGQGRDKAEIDAERVANEIGAFADLSGTSEPYAGGLAARGVIAFGTPYLSRNWHEERAPYAWSIAVDGTRVSEHGADYTVKKLAGGNADYAGGDLQGQERKFATLAPENPWYQESVENARRIVEEAGYDPGMNVEYVLDLGTMSNQATNIIAQLKREGVTTVICGCDPILPVFLSGVANRERYYPEFIIVGTALTDADIVGQLWDQNFAAQAFGVSPLNQFKPATETIAYAAFKQMRPDEEPAFSVDLIYYQMYELAIGIQMAGPNLNPSTFEQGMFAYPPKMGDVGRWSFAPGDRTGADDVREIYWDPEAISEYNGEQGAYIGVSNERYLPGQIPEGDPGKPKP